MKQVLILLLLVAVVASHNGGKGCDRTKAATTTSTTTTSLPTASIDARINPVPTDNTQINRDVEIIDLNRN